MTSITSLSVLRNFLASQKKPFFSPSIVDFLFDGCSFRSDFVIPNCSKNVFPCDPQCSLGLLGFLLSDPHDSTGGSVNTNEIEMIIFIV